MKTSIIIPCHNYAAMLPDLFASIASQTSGLKDVEVVFADDASSDGSLETARQLGPTLGCAFKAVGFAPMRHPALTRNAGMTLASGRLLLFVDPDDILEPDYLLDCTAAFSKGADIVYSDYIEESPSGSRVVVLPDFSDALLRTQNILPMCTMMRRKVFETLGGFNDDTVYEDWEFWVRATLAKFTFARVPRPLYRYRLHDGNFSHEARQQDGPTKASIVLNSPDFFTPEVRRWAKAVLEGKPWAQHFSRGLIPRDEDVRKLRDLWANMKNKKA